MQFLKYLVWGFSTREGRDEFFGPSKANQAHYKRSYEMRERFETKYPAIETHGSVDNFIGCYQWSEGDRHRCYLIPEGESFAEAEQHVRYQARGHSLYLWRRDELDTEIPLLLWDQTKRTDSS